MNDTIGIDISKGALDAYWLSKREHQQFSNDDAGLKSLVRWVQQAAVSLIVFEATGVYHRLLETVLATHSIPFARVNPRQARRFAEGAGQLAKTDQVPFRALARPIPCRAMDAAILAKMGSLLELKTDQPRSETLYDLKQLATARQALIKDRTAARARLQIATHPLLKRQVSLRLQQVERDIARIDAAMLATVAADKDLSERAEILTRIPGIATVTAFALLIDPLGTLRLQCPAGQCMPELGHLSGKQAAKLAGLAPISKQSGKWQGKEHIQGGRASVRRAVYLPAVVATRFNPDMKAKYEQLISAEKCKKLAITAFVGKTAPQAVFDPPHCASSSSWQMLCYATVGNGMNIPLDQYGYSSIAMQSTASRWIAVLLL